MKKKPSKSVTVNYGVICYELRSKSCIDGKDVVSKKFTTGSLETSFRGEEDQVKESESVKRRILFRADKKFHEYEVTITSVDIIKRIG